MAITSAFKEWRRYLEGARHKINVCTDNKGLEWVANNKPLNRRQARWALELDGFDFVIIYRPGVKNGKPDALSRRSEFRPEKGGQGYQPVERVLKEGQWIPESYREQWTPGSYRDNLNTGREVMLSSVQIQGLRPVVRMTKELESEIVGKAAEDPIWQEEHAKARKNHAVDGEVLSIVTYKDGMLFRKGKIWIPDDSALKKLISENEHDTIVAGHMGMDKTLEMISRNFYWPHITKEIEDYVSRCGTMTGPRTFLGGRRRGKRPQSPENGGRWTTGDGVANGHGRRRTTGNGAHPV